MQQAAENTEVNKEKSEKAKPAGEGSNLTLSGRFSRYTSVYWQILLPFLSTRYFFEGLDNLTDFNHRIRHWGEKIQRVERPKEKLFGRFPNEGVGRWVVSNIPTLAFGSAVAAITAFYTNRTAKDIKTLYAEAVGYERDKNPEDIRFGDLRRSKNEMVKTTVKALISRTTKRFAATLSFFVPWGMLNPDKYHNTDQLDNIGFKLGTGIEGFYLFSDGFFRKQSFFEAMQEIVDTKINHAEGNPGSVIDSGDIVRLLVFQRKARDKSYRQPSGETEEWKKEKLLTDRIADLMNQTYHNTPGEAHFTVGKFVYLVGAGLLDTFPKSLAFVELANRSPDMKIKQAASMIKSGTAPEAVFMKYGVTLGKTDEHVPSSASPPEPASTQHRDKVQPSTAPIPQTARRGLDFAAAPADTAHSLR